LFAYVCLFSVTSIFIVSKIFNPIDKPADLAFGENEFEAIFRFNICYFLFIIIVCYY